VQAAPEPRQAADRHRCVGAVFLDRGSQISFVSLSLNEFIALDSNSQIMSLSEQGQAPDS